ncbi:hypothetical protein M514_09386 [Trichuris suis]|uniref:Uncharacterized protein n=1 Tax=Trichuris suis TaxID=68888 RepID=A0A085MXT5_9BILA|nr:hypothetical protein M513_09386 [Trichuris suis]KFD62031.1 hypothetical protein M514_09386 [Trichuris suis]
MCLFSSLKSITGQPCAYCAERPPSEESGPWALRTSFRHKTPASRCQSISAALLRMRVGPHRLGNIPPQYSAGSQALRPPTISMTLSTSACPGCTRPRSPARPLTSRHRRLRSPSVLQSRPHSPLTVHSYTSKRCYAVYAEYKVETERLRARYDYFHSDWISAGQLQTRGTRAFTVKLLTSQRGYADTARSPLSAA